jgi:hypothetical protein
MLDVLALPDAALGELPATRAGALPEEYVAVVAHQDDADIGAIPLCVDPITHGASFTNS